MTDNHKMAWLGGCKVLKGRQGVWACKCSHKCRTKKVPANQRRKGRDGRQKVERHIDGKEEKAIVDICVTSGPLPSFPPFRECGVCVSSGVTSGTGRSESHRRKTVRKPGVHCIGVCFCCIFAADRDGCLLETTVEVAKKAVKVWRT